MLNIILHNSNGQELDFSMDETAYQVVSVLGLDPPAANINLTDMAGLDGASFNSAYIGPRNIVINLKINGDADANRAQIYRLFPLKSEVTVLISTGTLNVQATGYIESLPCTLFELLQMMQISIICPDPKLYDQTEEVVEISGATEITSDAETPLGVLIRIEPESSADSIRIWTEDGSGSGIPVQELRLSGDFDYTTEFEISTIAGKKYVRYKQEEGDWQNGFGFFDIDSDMIQLMPGLNEVYASASGNGTSVDVSCTVSYRYTHEGV